MSEKGSDNGASAAQVLIGVIGLVVAAILKSQLGDICSTPEDERLLSVMLFWGVPCVLSTVFGVNKNRGLFGFIVGALLGWIGVIIIGCFKKVRS